MNADEKLSLFNRIEPYLKDQKVFAESVGHLFPNGINAALDALDDTSDSIEQIRAARNPTDAQKSKIKAFYAIMQAFVILSTKDKVDPIYVPEPIKTDEVKIEPEDTTDIGDIGPEPTDDSDGE